MKVLALGLPRTGTLSMAEALTELGYQNVHHTLKLDMLRDDDVFRFLSRAADASFPSLPGYTGEPLTGDGFDAIYGGCEGAAEGAALFAPQLIRAYPDAKVVVAVRDFDGWRRSVEDVVFRGLWCPLADLFVRFVEPTLGIVTISTMRKGNLGFYEARDADEARRNARMAYDRHHRVIQQMVPPEQLLFYKMGQGWEPLCEFLGKPVPDKPFPQSNEARGLKVQATKFFLVAFAMASWRRVSYLWRPILLGLGLWVAAAKVFRVT